MSKNEIEQILDEAKMKILQVISETDIKLGRKKCFKCNKPYGIVLVIDNTTLEAICADCQSVLASTTL